MIRTHDLPDIVPVMRSIKPQSDKENHFPVFICDTHPA